MLATPLVFNPWGFDEYQLPRLALQTVLVLAMFSLAASRTGLGVHRSLVPLGCFLVWLLIASLLSADPVTALLGTSGRRFGLLGWGLLAVAYVSGVSLGTDGLRRWAVVVASVVGIPLSVYAVMQRIGIDPFLPSGSRLVRPASTVGSATSLGALLAVVLVCAVGGATTGAVRPLLGATSAALSTVALVLTQSRGAWLGAVAGLMVLVVVIRPRRRSLIGVAAVVPAAIAVFLLAPGSLRRASSIVAVTEGTAGGRVELAGMGLRAIGQRWLIGWGPDMSRLALHRSIAAGFEARFGDARIEDRAHNLLLDIGIWSGVVGVALFIWFAVVVGKAARAAMQEPVASVLGAALVGFVIHLMFNFPVPELDVVVWFVLGLLVAGSARRLTPIPGTIVAAPVLAVGVLLGPRTVDLLVADSHLKSGVDEETAGRPERAGLEYRSAQQSAPGDSLTNEVLARFLLRQDQALQALDAASKAVASEPADPYLRELAANAMVAASLDAGDTALAMSAETEFVALLEASPNDGSLWMGLGGALAGEARLEDAFAAFGRAAELLPRDAEPVARQGLVAERLGWVDMARTLYVRAVLLDPLNQMATSGLQRLGSS